MTKAEFVDAMIAKYDNLDFKKRYLYVRDKLTALSIPKLIIVVFIALSILIVSISGLSCMVFYDILSKRHMVNLGKDIIALVLVAAFLRFIDQNT